MLNVALLIWNHFSTETQEQTDNGPEEQEGCDPTEPGDKEKGEWNTILM